jgi:glutamate dehydrogenase
MNDGIVQPRIDEAAGLALAGCSPTDGAALAAFVRSFYRNVPPTELLDRSPAALAETALAMWAFVGVRVPGEPTIHVAASAPDRGIVRVVNDDRRFLVDSVTAALTGLGFEIDLVIHPVMSIRRDETGRLLVGSAEPTPPLPETLESIMHIEVTGDLSEERPAAIVARLASVLEDVRVVVEDWPAIRAQVAAIAAETARTTHPVSAIGATDPAEDAAFVAWLDRDNFLFLGTREYVFHGNELDTVPGVGKGLLRDDSFLVFDGLRAITRASPDVQAFLRAPLLTMISKSNRRSTVHRAVPMDTVIVKTMNEAGEVNGLRLIVGLFTQDSYSRLPHEIPVLRQKVRRCHERSGFAPDSRDGKTLQHILDHFPRDELFQIDETQLFETAIGILHLQQRPRLALFVMRDPFERFVTCLVYLPRDRVSAEIGRRIAGILEQAVAGSISVQSTHFEDAKLARLHFVIATVPGQAAEFSVPAIERRLTEALRTWADRLGETVLRLQGKEAAAASLHRYATAFPPAYIERVPVEVAVRDMAALDAVAGGAPIAVRLSQPEDGDLRLSIFHVGEPVALSDVLPMLENLGMRVINEIPFEVTPRGVDKPIWIQDFELRAREAKTVDLDAVKDRFEGAFREVWGGTLENDGFNRLVMTAGLSAREVVVLRAYCKLMRQTGTSFSQAYMEDTASAHPVLAGLLVKLFDRRADPALAEAGRATEVATITAGIRDALEHVDNLDEDRILRGFLLLIEKTLRTNYHQRDEAGHPKPYLSLKLASREIDLLPLPRPLVEIFVYSPRMEGCHLRGGKVARGGIRWSDRKEDFRTEVLGLMKAQMVKNAVIVPIGSKGGFVVKRPPVEGGRDALMAEGIACYKTLMSGLLDLTDDIAGNAVVPPKDVVRHDPDDTYLVVAADKGTATFSDIANGVAIDYGFWLGDAFASGGSIGYDHKVMGITAKGAWEAVKRHFREIGTDIQTTDFTCVGVGDMSGDVFGNGMLLSRRIKLVAAFNHMHIFIDPNPDPERSWIERKRMFDLPRSSWTDYDSSVLSEGGGIYERRAKSIALSPQACARLGLDGAPMAPAQLIQALLRQDVDLLWFGGIGTYVKATTESHAQAGDRANDSLRVDAPQLRAKVVGEGANLAMTQRARIEYALHGGRINTDAIDNSAGVDTSDHEVNIKIAVGDAIAAGLIAPAERRAFLASMTDDVEHHVLNDNYLQTLAVTLAEANASALLDAHARLMRAMERRGRLDRAVEFLPDDETLAQRSAAMRGLTRPEIAVILAYAKNGLYDELLASGLPDLPELRAELLHYFPPRLRELAPDTLLAHRLRREIVATVVTNALVNRMGPSFVEDTQTRSGRDSAAVAAAYLIVRDVFELPAVWSAIEALDNKVPAVTQTRLLLAIAQVVDQAVRWFLQSGLALEPGELVARFQPGVRALAVDLTSLLPERERAVNAARVAGHVDAGAPVALAERIVTLNTLSTAMDIVQISEAGGADIAAVARSYFAVGADFGLLMLRRQARMMAVATPWQRLAADALADDSYAQQREIVRRVVAGEIGAPDLARRTGPGTQLQDVLAEIARTSPPDLAMLTVASRRIRPIERCLCSMGAKAACGTFHRRPG